MFSYILVRRSLKTSKLIIVFAFYINQSCMIFYTSSLVEPLLLQRSRMTIPGFLNQKQLSKISSITSHLSYLHETIFTFFFYIQLFDVINIIDIFTMYCIGSIPWDVGILHHYGQCTNSYGWWSWYRSIYLPLYSPEFNPIENFRSTMKSWRHWCFENESSLGIKKRYSHLHSSTLVTIL